jgi:hypothetical protein
MAVRSRTCGARSRDRISRYKAGTYELTFPGATLSIPAKSLSYPD